MKAVVWLVLLGMVGGGGAWGWARWDLESRVDAFGERLAAIGARRDGRVLSEADVKPLVVEAATAAGLEADAVEVSVQTTTGVSGNSLPARVGKQVEAIGKERADEGGTPGTGVSVRMELRQTRVEIKAQLHGKALFVTMDRPYAYHFTLSGG